MKRKMWNLLCWGKKSKGKAPLPPGERRSSENSPSFDSSDTPHYNMDQKENIIDRDIELTVVLPGEKTALTTVRGSKPMMDLLIFLCGQYHLNPSSHTLDLISTEGSQIKFKPNTPIGMLEVGKVVLKSKIIDDKNKRSHPAAPEQTVRVVINYKKTQKTVMRVSPHIPLQDFFLSVCNKCEFDPIHTVLLKEHQCQQPLDLTKSLNDLGLRELYAVDRSKATSPTELRSTPLQESCQNLETKSNEDKGFFNFFRRSKKKRDQISSAPSTPQLGKARPNPDLGKARPGTVSKPYDTSTITSDVPKKRRAPLPPMLPPLSSSNSISRGQARTSSCIVKSTVPQTEKVAGGIDRSRAGSLQLSGSSSFNSPLRTTKRKAPPPPPAPKSSPDSNETALMPEDPVYEKGTTEEEMQNTAPQIADDPEPCLDEIKEKEEMFLSQEEGKEEDKTEDVSMSSASTDIVLEFAEEPCNWDSDMANCSKHSEDEIMIPNDNCLPLENHDIVLESATLEYKSQSHSVNGTLTQIKDGSQESEVKVHHKEMEVQTLPYIQSNEKKNTGCQDIISAVHYDIKETAVQSSSKKGKTQDSAVQTVNFDLDGTDVNINGVKELEQAQDTSLADSSVISKSSQPINQNQELSGNELEEKALDLSSGETPCSIESVHTLQNTHANITESMINSPSKSYQSYIKDSEPKPKPSNEITRDYLPKVGMTTYKIVPQRSFEIERHDLEFTQDDRNQDTMSEPNKRLPSPASAKSLSPVRLAREAFFSELSSAVKNGSHSPQQRTHVNPLSPISQNISLIHPKEHTDLSKMSDAPDLKSDKPGITRTKSNQIAPGSVKAPSSFYLQMQRRASSMYVTSAAAKMSKSLTSPTNNEVIFPGKDTSELITKSHPSMLDGTQLTTRQGEIVTDSKPLFADKVFKAQSSIKTDVSTVHSRVPLTVHGILHEDKLDSGEGNNVTKLIPSEAFSHPKQTPSTDVHLPSPQDDKPLKDCLGLDDRISQTKHLNFGLISDCQLEDAKMSQAVVIEDCHKVTEMKIGNISYSSNGKNDNEDKLLSTGEKILEVTTEPLNVLPVTTRHIFQNDAQHGNVLWTSSGSPPGQSVSVLPETTKLDFHDEMQHDEVSKTSPSKTVKSSSSPTGHSYLMLRETTKHGFLNEAPDHVSEILSITNDKLSHSPTDHSISILHETTKHGINNEAQHDEAPGTSSSTTKSVSPTGQSVPLSLQKLRTFATPRPFSGSFGVSSSLGVKRSQSFSSGSGPVKQPLKATGWSSVASANEMEVKNYSPPFPKIAQEHSDDQILTPEITCSANSQPPVVAKKPTVSFASTDPELIRQNLLAAIRSGEAAANLKRTAVRSNTICINGRSGMSNLVLPEGQEFAKQ